MVFCELVDWLPLKFDTYNIYRSRRQKRRVLDFVSDGEVDGGFQMCDNNTVKFWKKGDTLGSVFLAS